MSTVFRSGIGNNHTVRIPALVAVGPLLVAFCEGRRDSSSDTGEIVIQAATSADGGQSWSAPVETTAVPGRTCGNPMPVVLDEQTVLLVSTSNAAHAHERDIIAGRVGADEGRRVHSQRISVPDLVATPAVDITDQAKRDDWGWYATGPGHGIRLARGPHRGRIVVPANHSVIDGPGRSVYGAHLLLSDDDGRTWRIGHVEPGVAGCSGPNESSATELGESQVVVSIRNQCSGDDEVTRAFLVSDDGGVSGTLEPHGEITMPRIQSSVTTAQLDGRAVLVMSGPCDPRERAAMGLRLSVTGGRTWTEPWILGPGPAAYSDLAVDRDGVVHLVHECGEQSPYERIAHVAVDPSVLAERTGLDR